MSYRSSLLLTAAALTSAAATAQVGTNYTFTQTLGTYSPITGGTLVAQANATITQDDVIHPVTLPFTFTFDGGSFTQIQVSTNGSIAFGGVPHGTTNYAPISAPVAVPGIVSAFSNDMQGGYVFGATRTIGSAILTNANVSSNGPLQVGDQVTGTGIPVGTTVVAITGNLITMSANATATSATPAAVTAFGPWSAIRTETTGAPGDQVFTVQWGGWRRFGSTLTTTQDLTLNFQIRLHQATGKVEVVYGTCTPGVTTFATSVHQVGLRGPTNAFPANVNNRRNTKGVNDNWLNSVAGNSSTAGMAFNNIAPANVIGNGLTYSWELPTGIAATNTAFGTGCYTTSATWYEQFGSFDLATQSVRLTPNGAGGYTMSPGTPTSFVHTIPGLGLGDDSVGTLALPAPFNYPGGATTTLDICSNGYIWLQTNAIADFTPNAAELFLYPARFCPLWVDVVPDGLANTNNVFAQVDVPNNKAYVTWVNVPTFTTPGTVNMQVEFNLTSGTVNYTYGAITLPAVTSIVGWTPGTGVSTVNAGSVDVSASLAATFSTSATEALSLALAAAPTPVIGATVVYTTSNIPPSALISANLLSLGTVNPGAPLGATPAGCSVYVNLLAASTNLLFGGPTATQSFAVPNNPVYAGLPILVQSASLVPGINSLGVITSNAVRSVVGTL